MKTFEIWESEDPDDTSFACVPADSKQKDMRCGENRKLLLTFKAKNLLEACQTYYEFMNYGVYNPILTMDGQIDPAYLEELFD